MTCCDNTDEVLDALAASPEYFALIGCEPAANAVVVHCAVDADPTATVATVLAPSRNATVPVGVALAPMEAVKVTLAPYVDGLALEFRLV